MNDDDADSFDQELRELARAPEVPLPRDPTLPAVGGTSLTEPSPPPAGEPLRSVALLPLVPREVYAIAGEHARGGMGRILHARDLRLGRDVAIKELLAPEATASGRFVREALVTARLQHPSIVPVHEAGRWPSGEPFYAMKLVRGRPLDELIAERTRLDERLGLLPVVRAVAEAVAYAHGQRVIHRDLKPANVLVGDFGETVVVDWGLAKEIDAPPDDAVNAGERTFTTHGAIVGTPAYMAPEQAAGRPLDERADVYALGAMLYKTLSGRSPYSGPVGRVIDDVLQGPPPPLAQLVPEVAPDLLAIVDKAMARDPQQRYVSAKELAADLERFTTGQLVAAHRYSRLQKLERWLKRHRLVLVTASAALVLLAIMAVLSILRIVHEREQALRQRAAAEAARAGEAERFDELVVSSARAALQSDPTAAQAWLAKLRADSSQWPAARAIAAAAEVRGVAGRLLDARPGSVSDVAFAPDGKQLATVGPDGAARLWDLARGDSIELSAGGELERLFFARDGASLFAAGSGDRVAGWDLGDGKPRPRSPHAGGAGALTLSPDGHLFASGDEDGVIHVWSARDNTPLPPLTAPRPALQLTFSPDGALLAARMRDGVRVWRRGERAPLPPLEAEVAGTGAIAFSPDGKRLAIGASDGVHLWTLATRAVDRLREEDPVARLCFSPDGKQLATAGEAGTVRLWELDTRHATLQSHRGDPARDLVFSPDGRRLASARGSIVRVWELASGELRKLRGHELEITRLAFSPDGTRLASASLDGTARLWTLDRGEPRLDWLPPLPNALAALTLSPDGRIVAWAPVDDPHVLVWRADAAAPLRLDRGPLTPCSLALSPDGQRLAAVGDDADVRLWDLAGGAPERLHGHRGPVHDVVFLADGRGLATAGEDGTLRLWDATGGVRTLASDAPLQHVAVSPRGDALATINGDGALRLWNRARGTSQPLSSRQRLGLVTFSADGALVAASAAGSREVWLWRVADGRPLRSIQLERPLAGLAAQAAQVLVFGSRDGSIEAHDAASGEHWPLGGHRATLLGLAASSAGVAAVDAERLVRAWLEQVPLDRAALRRWLGDGAAHLAGP